MKTPAPHDGERAWTTAWEAWARDDAAARPPVDLERRVLEAARRAHESRASSVRPARRPWPIGGLMAAAAVVIVAVGVAGLRSPRVATPPQDVQASPVREAGGFEPRAREELTPSVSDDLVTTTSSDVADRSSRDSVPLAVDRLPPPETVQLVRIRMPVAALAALGIATTNPDASGEVDVDVTVGDDGLARDIRGIHAVPAQDRE